MDRDRLVARTVALLASGRTYAQTAAELEVSRSRVQVLEESYRATGRRVREAQEELAALEALVAEEAAALMG